MFEFIYLFISFFVCLFVERFELGRKWCLYLGRKVWIGENVGWKGCSFYVLYEIWSLEGSYGGDVIAVLCMWGSEIGMSRIGEAHVHATTCDRALLFNS
jgi:hypothetical protein